MRHSYSKPRGSLKTLKKKHFAQVSEVGGGPEMRSQEPRSLDSSQKPESITFKLYDMSSRLLPFISYVAGASFLVY